MRPSLPLSIVALLSVVPDVHASDLDRNDVPLKALAAKGPLLLVDTTPLKT